MIATYIKSEIMLRHCHDLRTVLELFDLFILLFCMFSCNFAMHFRQNIVVRGQQRLSDQSNIVKSVFSCFPASHATLRSMNKDL